MADGKQCPTDCLYPMTHTGTAWVQTGNNKVATAQTANTGQPQLNATNAAKGSGVGQRKDPNAPKKPFSAYFRFRLDERLKVKGDNPDYSIKEVDKELRYRWETLNPGLKKQYEQRYKDARKVYDLEMSCYKLIKKKTDLNDPQNKT